MTEKTDKPSAVEVIKADSRQLRGDIGPELVDGNPFFSKGSVQLIKHHGFYQEDNRDTRKEARAAGRGKDFIFMVRTKIPGGKLTSEQMLAELELCDEVGYATLRVTSRQGLQIHGIVKDQLTETIRRINEVQLSTLGACGDVNRNVMCCPAPYAKDPVHREMQALADQLAEHFAPRSNAYHELWLTDTETGEKSLEGGSKESGDSSDVEPIYGKVYLPRKFKMAVCLPEDNCIDIYTHDLGFLAISENNQIVGYNVLVGGGQGVTPSAKKTFPALAKKLTFIPPEKAIALAEAVVKVQRDFGNRSDRKIARLKYLLAGWGVEKFKAKVEEYLGESLPEPREEDVHHFDDHMGWFEQGDGKWFYGLNVENGRIKDDENIQLKSALREICTTLKPGIRLTSHQDILFTDIGALDRARLEEILQRHHVPLSEDISTVRRWSMACVAWPTCALSVTESERALPGIMDQFDKMLEEKGLAEEKFIVRMTGCPNGCARPYNCDVGLVGRTLGKYTIFLGGRLLGDRLNTLYKDLVPEEEVVDELAILMAYFQQDRLECESFGDFCHRKGVEDLQAFAQRHEAAPSKP